ncbi:hypothetical protein B9Z55_009767 [Caenorhabditis nigoni]|uniref:Programmed cell death protein 2 C-terminal domain-containing protein n=1 Tax=Caenorhabditis nigoni TaxID=1611254 RepID=A0A2G5UTE6_9PELO|nr:hypothetical protein B9Z55_009767 [Caenorhabditis nigoni]
MPYFVHHSTVYFYSEIKNIDIINLNEPVYLGFGAEVKVDDLYRLHSKFLPLGKIGGKPSWLNPKHLPKSTDLLCKVCEKPMCFLMQVCANGGEHDPPHAFHRTIFLFVCRNPAC